MSLSQHISFAQLVDLAEQRLAPEAGQSSRQHLAACAPCAKGWARLSNVVALMRDDRSEDAPRDAVFSVVNMFRDQRRADQRLTQRLWNLERHVYGGPDGGR
jgi:anti-sigma factor ChrR (cupin superfamily)